MRYLEIARSITVMAQASKMLATEIPCSCGEIPAIALLKVHLFSEIFVSFHPRSLITLGHPWTYKITCMMLDTKLPLVFGVMYVHAVNGRSLGTRLEATSEAIIGIYLIV